MAQDVKFVNLGNGFSRMSGICAVTGELYQLPDLAHEDIDRWRKGALVQEVFPQLTDDQREFLISKLTPAEFNCSTRRIEKMEPLFYREGPDADRMTEMGLRISASIELALQDILDAHTISARDFGAVAHGAVEMIVCEAVLSKKP